MCQYFTFVLGSQVNAESLHLLHFLPNLVTGIVRVQSVSSVGRREQETLTSATLILTISPVPFSAHFDSLHRTSGRASINWYENELTGVIFMTLVNTGALRIPNCMPVRGIIINPDKPINHLNNHLRRDSNPSPLVITVLPNQRSSHQVNAIQMMTLYVFSRQQLMALGSQWCAHYRRGTRDLTVVRQMSATRQCFPLPVRFRGNYD